MKTVSIVIMLKSMVQHLSIKKNGNNKDIFDFNSSKII
jgi:hypothetical protein